jgi:uncharacterized membrane protein YeiB
MTALGPTTTAERIVTLDIWSAWWLARFHFGPAEWLWRTLTYGQRQPIRILQPVPLPLQPSVGG